MILIANDMVWRLRKTVSTIQAAGIVNDSNHKRYALGNAAKNRFDDAYCRHCPQIPITNDMALKMPQKIVGVFRCRFDVS